MDVTKLFISQSVDRWQGYNVVYSDFQVKHNIMLDTGQH